MLENVSQEIAILTSEVIQQNVIITNKNGIIIGSEDQSRLGLLHEASLHVIKTGVKKAHDPKNASLLKGVEPGITLPIELGNNIIGTVGITGYPSSVSKFGMLAKKHIELLLKEEVYMKSALLRDRSLQSLIQEITAFDSEKSNKDVLVMRGKDLGYDLEIPRISIAIDLSRIKSIGNEIKNINLQEPLEELQSTELTVLSIIKNIFGNSNDICSLISNDKFIIFHSIKSTELVKEEILCTIKSKCKKVLTELKNEGMSASIGIGSISETFEDLGQSYKDSLKTLKIGKKLNYKPGIFVIDDLIIEYLLSEINQSTSKQYIKKKLKKIDEYKDNVELYRTIKAWFESGLSPIKASKSLNIHKNTLFYRLDKIERITGNSLRNSKSLLELYLAIHLKILNGIKKEP